VSSVKRMKAGPLTAPDPDSTSTPATSVCLEPITKMLSSLNSLGGLGVSLIASAVIVFVLGVAGVGVPVVPELLSDEIGDDFPKGTRCVGSGREVAIDHRRS
jgi:hypothetical protein